MRIYYKKVCLKDGSYYEGTGYDKGKRFVFHGNGKRYNKQGELCYEGDYVDGKRSGKGKEYLFGNLFYEGDFLNGSRHGSGTAYVSGRILYKGDFYRGLEYGTGMSYTKDGSILFAGAFIRGNYYEGDLVDGKACGKGKLYNIYTSKLQYEGDMENDKPNGKGIKYNFSGVCDYCGEFANGFPHGRGRRYLWNGKIREGIFVHDDYYVGDVSNGKANGKGRLYNIANKLSYEGDFVDGFEHGWGKQYFLSQKLWYEGDFVKGRWEGKGKQYNNNVLTYEGDFKGGLWQGQGIWYIDGIIHYEGDFVHGKKHGKGMLFDLSGNLFYVGDFSNGQKHGKGNIYMDGYLCYKGDFLDGERTGRGIEYRSGRLFYEGQFLSGRFHGVGRVYNPDGSIQREGIFRKDKFVKNAPFLCSNTEPISMKAPLAPTKASQAPVKASIAPPLPPKEFLTLTEENLIFPEEPKASLESGSILDSCLQELNDLIGLAEVKREIHLLVDELRLNNERKRRGLAVINSSHHLVFMGNPGTGKTTVARLLSKIFKELGVVSKGTFVETDRAGLVGAYIGHTEQKTDQIIEKARGGILFIDEAYALVSEGMGSHDYGTKAIDTLLKRMEDYRDDLVVVAAGYDAPMECFLDSNPGLKSRFPTVIRFANYTEQELMEIMLSLCAKNGCHMDEDSQELFLFQIKAKTQVRNFSNGRYIRNLFEKLVKAQAARLSNSLSEVSDDDLTKFTEQDVQYLIMHDEFERTN